MRIFIIGIFIHLLRIDQRKFLFMSMTIITKADCIMLNQMKLTQVKQANNVKRRIKLEVHYLIGSIITEFAPLIIFKRKLITFLDLITDKPIQDDSCHLRWIQNQILNQMTSIFILQKTKMKRKRSKSENKQGKMYETSLRC